MRTLPLLLALAACRVKDLPYEDTTSPGGADSAPDSAAPVDADGDGSPAGEDCDDADPTVTPGAAELCDGLDNNCDGAVDEGVGSTWYPDADGDGHGVEAGASVACEAPSGTAAGAGDCDDADPAVHPGAEEADCADPTDYNCDGSVGYADADGDGHAACEDCDDADPGAWPGAAELCDGVDNSCDGQVDEGVLQSYYEDNDGDGFGDADYPTAACALPSGYSATAGDCDDADGAIHPDASEVCDALDNDCDTLVDDADPSLDLGSASAVYTDADGDGWGLDSSATLACAAASGQVAQGGDCDDGDAAVNPGATDTPYDGVDTDCSGGSDNDADGDGVDALAAGGTDCDDSDAATWPGATELCDAVDNDCDGELIDVDLDGDGVRDLGTVALEVSGNNDHVYVPANSALDWGTGDWTIELWTWADDLQGPDTTGFARLLNQSNGGYPSNPWWVIDIYTTGLVEMEVAGWVGTSIVGGSGASTAGIGVGEWVHIAIVSDRAAGTVQFYLNGEDAGSYSPSASFNGADVSSPAYLQLGSTWNDWDGKLDEVRLWTTARTQAEVQGSMCSPLGGTEAGLQGYWSFESSAADEGPNALGGTLTGGAALVSY